MATKEAADDLVLFLDVRIIRTTAPALLCRIGGKNVWLPRWHVSGKPWCIGDRGKLFIRRWIARDRHLFDPPGAMTVSLAPSLSRLPPPPDHLRLLQGGRNTDHAK